MTQHDEAVDALMQRAQHVSGQLALLLAKKNDMRAEVMAANVPSTREELLKLLDMTRRYERQLEEVARMVCELESVRLELVRVCGEKEV